MSSSRAKSSFSCSVSGRSDGWSVVGAQDAKPSQFCHKIPYPGCVLFCCLENCAPRLSQLFCKWIINKCITEKRVHLCRSLGVTCLRSIETTTHLWYHRHPSVKFKFPCTSGDETFPYSEFFSALKEEIRLSPTDHLEVCWWFDKFSEYVNYTLQLGTSLHWNTINWFKYSRNKLM